MPSRLAAAVSPIRWDRLARVALLGVFAVLVLLYVGPAKSYVQALGQASARDAEVKRLEHEQARLKARQKALTQPGTLEREARRLGYVKPGERPYVVEDLPSK